MQLLSDLFLATIDIVLGILAYADFKSRTN